MEREYATMTILTRNRRGGFTLVELLVSIAIIGMLMSLTSVAVWKVIQSVKSAKITVEVDQLAQAMQSYKEGQIQFPPCMGIIDVTARRIQFLRHLSVAYPNCNYGTAIGNFTNTKTGIRAKVMGITPTASSNWSYNYVSDSGIQRLDLDTLDQAESLVFWLGGFPTPVNSSGVPVATQRLFGLHRDSDDPLKRDTSVIVESLRYRTDPLFGFDQTRLVDNDQDGWLEYAPLAPKLGASTAPYVYFDSATYNLSVDQSTVLHWCYPRIGDATNPGPVDLFLKFGVAAPMADYFDMSGTNPTRWAKPNGFQIICGGLDGEYSKPGVDLPSCQRIPIFPSGFVFERGSGSTLYRTQTAYSIPDYDNVTNLSTKTLEGARSEAQQ